MDKEIPRGHLSTFILSTLLDGDKYGYEIIKSIETKTDGSIVIKQPSLYSSLKRMEDQNLITSYWRDSDIGGRRHYYRLTDLGRKQTLEWQKDLLISQKSVNNLFDADKKPNTTPSNATKVLKQENLFDLTPPTDLLQNEKNNQNINSFVQFNLFERNIIAQPNENEFHDSAPLTLNPEVIKNEPYNVHEELYKVRSSSSFSDFIKEEQPKNYIYSHDNFNDIVNEESSSQINNSTMLNNNGNIDDAVFLPHQQPINENNKTDDNDLQENNNQTETPQQDQGIFITETLNIEDLPHVKKIEPSKFNELTSDKEIHFKQKNNQDVLDKLYEKANTGIKEQQTIQTNEYYESYSNLDSYLSSKNVKFYQYQKSINKKVNDAALQTKINLISYTSLSLLTFVSSLVLFLCSSSLNPIATSLFIIFPICLLLFNGVKFFRYKKGIIEIYKPNKNTILFQSLLLLIFALLIYSINLLLNIDFSNLMKFSATFIFPITIGINVVISTIINIIIQKKKSL